MSTNLHRNEMKAQIARFMTRGAAAKKCQLSLSKFSKLCIIKGIFPQEPKKNNSNKIYYLKKDIDFLLHDPIIKEQRDLKTLGKKVGKAQHMGEKEKLKKLVATPPTLHIDHIIKERYPTFLHAVQDLDDALTIIYLFARQNDSRRVLTADHLLCVRLCKEWEAIVIKMRALRKVFVSIKGIYYEAEICGQTVRWLTPHAFVNRKSGNKVDMNVMTSFLLFYKNMLPYVLYKLYDILGLHYPPKLDDGNETTVNEILKDFARQEEGDPKDKKPKSKPKLDKTQAKKIASLDNEKLIELDEAGQEREAAQQAEETEQEKEVVTTEVEKEFDVARDEAEAEVEAITKLFEGRKFFISREVSRSSLEMTIRSFGGLVSWEGPDAPFPESDTDIDYEIADRSHPKKKFFGRHYVQPQWVFDSVNEKILLPADQYALDATLPPHLSPFVFDASHKTYVPERRKYLDKLKIAMERGEEVASDEEEEEDVEGFVPDEEIENEAEVRYNREIQAEIQGEEYDEEKTKKADKQLKSKIDKQTKAKAEKDKERAETEGLLMMSSHKRKTHVWLKGVEKRAQGKIDVLEAKKRKINEETKSKKKQKSQQE